MSKKHLRFIGSLPCLCCGVDGVSVPHHLLRVENCYLVKNEGEEAFLIPKVKSKGMGTKSDDRFTIPVCSKCHKNLHLYGNEKRFLEECGVGKSEEIALSLFDKSGDYEKCYKHIKDLRKWARMR